MKCKICNKPTYDFAKAKVLNGKYNVNYVRCGDCGCVCVTNPHWLDESYGLNDEHDSGKIMRAKNNSVLINRIIKINNLSGSFLDYGCGKDMLFIKRIKDFGINFDGYDPYTNTYTNREKYSLITAFEVLEHFENPMEEFKSIFNMSDIFIGSTGVMRYENPQKPENWPYYALQRGRHIILYTLRSLKYIAEKHNLKLYHDMVDHFVFSKISLKLANYKLL